MADDDHLGQSVQPTDHAIGEFGEAPTAGVLPPIAVIFAPTQPLPASPSPASPASPEPSFTPSAPQTAQTSE